MFTVCFKYFSEAKIIVYVFNFAPIHFVDGRYGSGRDGPKKRKGHFT